MGVNGNTITGIVSFADVQTVLGESSAKLSVLCTSTKINKWARHKPLRFSNVFMPCGDQILDNNWANGADKGGNAGGLIRAWENTTPASITLLTFLGNSQDISFIKYDKPTGGQNDPFRIGDFRNYRHDAGYIFTGDVPLTMDISVDNYLGGSITLNIKHGAYKDPNDYGTILSGAEVTGAGKWYFGLLILCANGDKSKTSSYQADGWNFLYVTTAKKLSQYASGNTNDNNFVSVYNVDGYQYAISVKMPKQSDGGLGGNGDTYFDNYVGKDIMVYPIVTDAPYLYLYSGSSTGKMAKLAVDYAHYKRLTFNLKPASASGTYKRPSIALDSLTTAITYNNNIASVQLTRLIVKLTSKGGTSNQTYTVTEIRTAVEVTGKDSGGNTVTVFNTTSEGRWSGSEAISLSYVSGSTAQKTLIPPANVIATVNKTKTGLTNPSAKLVISVTVRNNAYTDVFETKTKIAISLNSEYM